MIGHVGVTLFIGFILNKFLKSDYIDYSLFLVIGSIFPDLIDKPIGSLFFETGRWFGHTLVVLTSLFIIASYFGKGKQFRELDIGNILRIWYFGSIFHLIEDIGISKTVVFWPFFGEFTSGARNDFLHGLDDPFTILFEIIGLGLIVIIGIHENWTFRSWKLLFAMILSYLLLFLSTYILLVIY